MAGYCTGVSSRRFDLTSGSNGRKLTRFMNRFCPLVNAHDAISISSTCTHADVRGTPVKLTILAEPTTELCDNVYHFLLIFYGRIRAMCWVFYR